VFSFKFIDIRQTLGGIPMAESSQNAIKHGFFVISGKKSAENCTLRKPFLKKQSQFAPDQISANSFTGEHYENKPRRAGRFRQNKSKQACPFDKPLRGKLRAGSEQRRMEPISKSQEEKESRGLLNRPILPKSG
jgi:hypothetical protein